MARWNFYLLNRDMPPLLFYSNVKEGSQEFTQALQHCANKVCDGSDADAFSMLRCDMRPSQLLMH